MLWIKSQTWGWIRDEVAIHFDIFTVRTVRLHGSGHLSTDEQRDRCGRFFPLPFRVNKDPFLVHIWTCIFLPVAHARSHSCDPYVLFSFGFPLPPQ